ncbi:MAG TPA: regulatory protein RecX [Steroidobacteraceae bacterium]
MPPFRKNVRPVDEERRADSGAVRAAAITLLARRDFAQLELHEKLTSRGFDAATVALVLAELARERLLDDERYAQNYVSFHARRGQGPVRIAADLRQLGLPGDLIEAALASGPDWHALARTARIAKFGAKPPDSWPEKARQARFLQYRGFSSDHIRTATGAAPDLD